jgi:peptidoglycan/xylan/chitin deacetylase (PgdA/CDA1 family)
MSVGGAGALGRAARDAVLAWSPAQWWCERRAAQGLTVLAYHGVENPETFARHLEYLREHRTPVSLEELLHHLAHGSPLPRGAVLITFDDGRRSVLEAGLPLLRQARCPAVIFPVAGLVGSSRLPWWEEVEDCAARGGTVGHGSPRPARELVRSLKNLPDGERRAALAALRGSARGPARAAAQLSWEELRVLRDGGVAIGNHTLTHPVLPRCADDTVGGEIRTAHELLAEKLGEAPLVFAYPNGDRDERATRLLRGLGYRAAFLFDHRLARLPAADAYGISRLRVDSAASPSRFRLIVSGLHSAICRSRGVL